MSASHPRTGVSGAATSPTQLERPSRVLALGLEESRLANLLRAAQGQWQLRSDGEPVDLLLVDRARCEAAELAEAMRPLEQQSPAACLVAMESKEADAPRGGAMLTLDHDVPDEDAVALAERAFRLHKLVTDPDLERVVGTLDRLPSVPHTFAALRDATSSSACSVAELVDIVESDPAMSLKILQLVNSTFFGHARRVTSVAQAVKHLGVELLKGMVVNAQVFTAAFASDGTHFSLERFQMYSVRTARLARTFAQGLDLGDDPFTAAIVHDIGELVLALKHPVAYAKVRARVVDTGARYDQLEKEIIGATHAEAGAKTLWASGVPFGIVECVAYHRTPRLVPAGPRALLATIHAVAALVGIVNCGDSEACLDREFLESVGLSERIAEWRRLVEAEAASWE